MSHILVEPVVRKQSANAEPILDGRQRSILRPTNETTFIDLSRWASPSAEKIHDVVIVQR